MPSAQFCLKVAYCLFCSALVPLTAAPLPRPYSVENYDLAMRVDLAKQRLFGEVKIRFHGQGDIAVSALELDAGSLKVTNVLEDEAPQSFDQNHGKLFVVLTRPVHPDEQRTIAIQYEAGPSAGLKFASDQAWGADVGDWMPCNGSSGERSTLHVILTGPADAKTAVSGNLISAHTNEGRNVTEWQLDSPAEPSRFGFALGTFAENTSDAGSVRLRVLGAGAEVLDPTAAAVKYLADRTGKPYPGGTYTQVFVHGDAIRSFANLALLPDSIVPGIAKQADHLRILAQALAQQWYGIGIAPKDWSDRWLSEGVSSFLADSFLGQRLGKEAYEREIERTRQVYLQLVSEGKDRSLSDSNWTALPDAGAGIPEYKGTWFLYLLHELMGDNAFLKGLQLYTSSQWGSVAASEDFQKAFDAANAGHPDAGHSDKYEQKARKNNPKGLDNLFDMWVYGISNELPKKRSK